MGPEQELRQWLVAMIAIIIGILAYDYIIQWMG